MLAMHRCGGGGLVNEFEGAEHLDDRCERGKKMDNPIPSAMVYFDEKQAKAILCLDAKHNHFIKRTACRNSSLEEGFHSHAWQPLGWMTEATFAQAKHGGSVAAEFVRDALLSLIDVRSDFEKNAKEKDAALSENRRLRTIIMSVRKSLVDIESSTKDPRTARMARTTINHTYDIPGP
jgi:hypothetical protein